MIMFKKENLPVLLLVLFFGAILINYFSGNDLFWSSPGSGPGPGPSPSPSDQEGGEASQNQVGGYPFAFIDQLDSTRSRYAPKPNCWPKNRKCDIEWVDSGAQDLRSPDLRSPDLPTYFGSGIPIKTDEVCTLKSDGDSMFYFKNFRSSPECCPGPYSSDGGCVCAFEKKVCEKWPQDLSKDPARITFN